VVRLAQQVTEDVRAFKPEPPVALHLSGSSPELRRAVGTLVAAQLAAAELGLPRSRRDGRAGAGRALAGAPDSLRE
jgi:hypothetical protein